ncbi:hypothetical protein pEaSNUABM40_00223 [Erwinia phage pEa_SNUABM_40]|uniref:Uncharacterized protein n=1 Tax=Erwinia phage pEa_SNUABM_3 TaxID=2869552 RepID=A0AAE7XJL0_9CAUD|nr:hypothetical protein MPK68_gp220 [Erwinia phage pEa_SNUABM_3]QZE56417.1 hypothetical protein pEaSNUABM3_00220 [Erwinia phage pEa_SNUABM_3]QZE58439.1 hypothetical protein pEaSNUABM40_00223 [Erwinia phage pEa_SNUABM_40]
MTLATHVKSAVDSLKAKNHLTDFGQKYHVTFFENRTRNCTNREIFLKIEEKPE